MSTIKSSDEHLTLNADGSSKDIKFQANGVEKASISSAGVLSSDGGSTHADNVKAKFGTGNDLEIYHSGGHSFIHDTGTGDLQLRGTDVRIKSDSDNDDMATFIENGAASLFHSNSKKLETTAAGVTVTGALLETAPRSGQIIQRHASNPNIGHHQTNSASWTELNTTFRVTITPQYANSSIEVDVLFMFGGNNTSNITHFRIYDVTNNAVPNIDTAGNRQGVHGSARQVDSDANDVDMMFISMRTTAGNTNARTYAFQAKNESGTTVKNYFASDSNASQLSYAKPIMRVTEVAA